MPGAWRTVRQLAQTRPPGRVGAGCLRERVPGRAPSVLTAEPGVRGFHVAVPAADDDERVQHDAGSHDARHVLPPC